MTKIIDITLLKTYFQILQTFFRILDRTFSHEIDEMKSLFLDIPNF